jgi:malate dehydrogenase
MSIIGVDEVQAVTGGTLALRKGDRLTPLARDRARELEITIVEASAPPPAGNTSAAPTRPGSTGLPRPVNLDARPTLTTPPAPALFRRGAPYSGLRGRGPTAQLVSKATTRSSGSKIARVTIVGSGNVGTHAAMRLAETDLVGEIVLVDLVEGLAKGVALDLTHASGLLRFATSIRGESSVEAAGRSDFTIITAGRPRQPGMSRTDLTAVNAGIVEPTAAAVGRVSPDGVIVVVTNPLDEMTELAWKASGLPSTRVVGMAGLLDSARFQALAGGAASARPDDVVALALGSHGDEMVVPISQATIAGKPAFNSLESSLTAVIDRTRNSGAEVVGLLGKGSAFITPGLAAARMVEYMIRGSSPVISATVRPEGQYGLRDVFVGLPVRLGRNGVSEIVNVDLAPAELSALQSAAAEIRARVGDLSPLPKAG